MYVPDSEKPLHRRVARFAAWKSGEALVNVLSRVTHFQVPDEPLQPFLHNLPMLLGRYEPETIDAMRQVVRRGMTVIDGGAHIGYFTVAVRKWLAR